ncbi:MAG: DUF3467 domain-containing protein [Blastocatellales bacterium]
MSNKEKTSAREIKLQRVFPDNLQSHFVTNMVVQNQPDMFILSFFEVWPPVILGETEEEQQQQIESIGQIEAKCVSRLVVTPQHMKEFLHVMAENLRKYEEMKLNNLDSTQEE